MVDFRTYFPVISQPAIVLREPLNVPDAAQILMRSGVAAAAGAVFSLAVSSAYRYATTGNLVYPNHSSIFSGAAIASFTALVLETIKSWVAAGKANAEVFLQTPVPAKSLMDGILKDRFAVVRIAGSKGLKKESEKGDTLLSLLFMKPEWSLIHFFNFYMLLIDARAWSSREILSASGLLTENIKEPLAKRNLILLNELAKQGKFKGDELPEDEKKTLKTVIQSLGFAK